MKNKSTIFIGADPGEENCVSLFEIHPDNRVEILSEHHKNYLNNRFKITKVIIDGECEDITNKRALPKLEGE